MKHLNRTDQRLAASALIAGHRIAVIRGTLIIMRFNRTLWERVKSARTKIEKANTHRVS